MCISSFKFFTDASVYSEMLPIIYPLIESEDVKPTNLL